MPDDDPIDEHRTQTPTEDELLAARRKLEQQMLENELKRWNRQINQRRPPGAARLRGFRTAQPGPVFRRDPFERPPEEAADGTAQPFQQGSGAGAMPYPQNGSPPRYMKPPPQTKRDPKKIAAAMGEVFVSTVGRDPAQARRDFRDALMMNAPNLCTDIGEIEKLWRFALDIDKELLGGKHENQGGDRTEALRKWLQGGGVEDM